MTKPTLKEALIYRLTISDAYDHHDSFDVASLVPCPRNTSYIHFSDDCGVFYKYPDYIHLGVNDDGLNCFYDKNQHSLTLILIDDKVHLILHHGETLALIRS